MSHNMLGPQFFHGTNIHNADGILHTGARKSHIGAMGSGFYVTPDPEVAHQYADETGYGSEPAVLGGTIEAKNPIHFASPTEFYQTARDVGYEIPAEYGNHLFRQGHDAILAGRYGVLAQHGSFRPTHLRGTPDEPWTDLT